jgi:DNA-binding transcriptional MerR regulator
VKLYYRIGEVSQIVGVQPHVLRYWETEFRTIRPQKSHKGQRVYSRKDVEKLLRVKDLLKNQGFTIAGAKKKLRDPEPEVEHIKEPAVELRAEARASAPAATVPEPFDAAGRERQTRMREALVAIREDIVAMLEDADVPPRRPKLPSLP